VPGWTVEAGRSKGWNYVVYVPRNEGTAAKQARKTISDRGVRHVSGAHSSRRRRLVGGRMSILITHCIGSQLFTHECRKLALLVPDKYMTHHFSTSSANIPIHWCQLCARRLAAIASSWDRRGAVNIQAEPLLQQHDVNEPVASRHNDFLCLQSLQP
jgi:hypothetical protein